MAIMNGHAIPPNTVIIGILDISNIGMVEMLVS